MNLLSRSFIMPTCAWRSGLVKDGAGTNTKSLMRLQARVAKFRRVLKVIASTLIMVAIACSDGIEPTPVVPCADDQEVEVLVSTGQTPVFTWTPACGMASLQVFPTTGSPTSGWALYTGSRAAENPLRSGVRYGQAPPEALEPAPATALVAGTEYTITVYRWLGEAGGLGSLFPQGSATFQP